MGIENNVPLLAKNVLNRVANIAKDVGNSSYSVEAVIKMISDRGNFSNFEVIGILNCVKDTLGKTLEHVVDADKFTRCIQECDAKN